MKPPVIAVIGAGNMGSSLIGGLLKDGHPSSKIWATDISEEKLAQLKSQFNVHVTTDNDKAVESADIVILAVKPQYFAPVAKNMQTSVQLRKPLIISIAAGVRAASIQHWLGGNIAIVRAMPNTPALINCGATAMYANEFVSAEQHNAAESVLRAVGLAVWIEHESQMDTVTALSGSGPAYFFLVMEAMQIAAEELGLSAETARLLTLQTGLGATRMAMESDYSLEELRHQVTSPGGTTEKAVSVLEEHNIRELFKKALHGAKLRSEELAGLLGDK